MTAEWSVELWQPLGGLLALLPDASNKTFDSSLSEGDTFSFSLSGYDPNASLINEMFTDVVVYRDGDKIYRGRVVAAPQSADSNSCTINVSTVDYKTLLKRRFVKVAGTNTGDVEAVAWSYIDAVQTRYAGASFGITRGPAQTTGVTVTNFTRTAGVSIKDLIDGLGNATIALNSNTSFEWTIDADLIFRVYQPTRGKRTPTFVADWGGAILSYDSQFDPNSYANYFYVLGNGVYQATAQTDESRQPPPGGIFEEYVEDTELTTAAQVDARAFWLATYNGQMELTKTYNLELSNSRWSGPRSCWIGDFVKLDIQHGALNVQTDQLRVRELHVSVDPSGYENVGVTIGYAVPSSYRDLNRMSAFLRIQKRDLLASRAAWYNKMRSDMWKEYLNAAKTNGATSYEANASLERYNDLVAEQRSYNSQVNGGTSRF